MIPQTLVIFRLYCSGNRKTSKQSILVIISNQQPAPILCVPSTSHYSDTIHMACHFIPIHIRPPMLSAAATGSHTAFHSLFGDQHQGLRNSFCFPSRSQVVPPLASLSEITIVEVVSMDDVESPSFFPMDPCNLKYLK